MNWWKRLFGSSHRPPEGLPVFDPDATDFDVADTVTAAVEQWLAALWRAVETPELPVSVFHADDFSERPPMWLQGGPGR